MPLSIGTLVLQSLYYVEFPHLFVRLSVLKLDSTLESWPAWNPLCRSGWPTSCIDPPVSTSKNLGIPGRSRHILPSSCLIKISASVTFYVAMIKSLTKLVLADKVDYGGESTMVGTF